MSKILRILKLRPSGWFALSTAYMYLMQAGWYVHIRQTRLERWLRPPSACDNARILSHSDVKMAYRLAWYVDVASRHPFRWARCLQRSLALCLWMEQRGLEPSLQIGVRKEEKTLKAHAWVELNGKTLNDGPMVESDFAKLRQFRRQHVKSKTHHEDAS